jgi:pimeloyl-ACP methyl ester carboxylesterase
VPARRFSPPEVSCLVVQAVWVGEPAPSGADSATPRALGSRDAGCLPTLVRRLTQSTFAAMPFRGSRFHLHSRPTRTAERVVVLVHGLGGRGYETWGGLPARLFDGDGGNAPDVAVFDYRSFHRRIPRFGRGDVDAWAKQLSGYLQEIEDEYQDVFLIGHSQGGLVAETVVRERLTDRAFERERGPQPIAGLVLVASPLAGSGWAVPALASVVDEFGAMKRLARRSADMQTFFSTRVERQNLAESAGGRVVLPVYAAVATEDAFVSRFSATIGVPAGQIREFPHGHRSLAKPDADDHDLVAWLQRLIDERCVVREQSGRQRRHRAAEPMPEPAPGTLEVVTSFVTDPSGLRWSRVYDEACRAACTADVVVRHRGQTARAPLDLLVAVHDDAEVVAGSQDVVQTVRAAEARCRDDPRLTVGITPVGPKHASAVVIVRDWVRPAPAEFFVEGAADVGALREVLARLLQHVIARLPLHAGGGQGGTGLRLDAGPNDPTIRGTW